MKQKKKRAKRDLVTLALLLVLVLLVALAAVSGVASYRSVYNESVRTILQKNRAFVNRVDGWILLKENLVNYSAKLLRESSLPQDMLEQFFRAIIIANDDINDIFVYIPMEGLFSMTGDGEVLEREVGHWYEAATEEPGRVVFLSPFYDDAGEEFVFTAVRTIGNLDGGMGVLGIQVVLDAMISFVSEYSAGSSAISFILDRYGYIIMHPDEEYTPFSSRDMTIYESIDFVDEGEYAPMIRTILADGYYASTGKVYVGSSLESTGWYAITRVKTEYILNNASFALFGIVATVLLAAIGLVGGWAALRSVRMAMHEARREEEKSALLIESMPMACYFLDMDYDAIACNRTAIELFATKDGRAVTEIDLESGEMGFCEGDCTHCVFLSKEECFARKYLMKNYKQIIRGVDEEQKGHMFVAEQCRVALEKGSHSFDHDHHTLFGEIVPCGVTIVPVESNDGQAFACYIQDKRPMLEAQEASRRKEIAEEENREKTRFLAKMSHEIRTPLNSVMGIAEVELRKGIHSSETEQVFLRILSSSKLLLSIINDILDLSKVEAGKLEIIEVEYDTIDFIMDTVELNASKMTSNLIEFKLEVCESLPSRLVGDVLRIKQIISNLLSNAFKYTKAGEVRLSIGIESIRTGNVDLLIKVTDTGRGMSQIELESLFAEFMRFNVDSNQSIEGSGLGMAIVQWLIRLMNGDVRAESEPGVGTTIAIVIPQSRVGLAQIGRDVAMGLERLGFFKRNLAHLPELDIKKLPHGKVLVVDDVETNLEVVRGILELYSINAETVLSGRIALEKVQSGMVYDLIFMDHMMPDMDGIEATKAIRGCGYTGAIVALTANAVKDSEEAFISSGFDGFIPKPINVERLNEVLLKYIPG